MIGWSAINPLLLDVFRDAARDATKDASNFAAEWSERPARFTDPRQGFSLRLRVTSVSELAEDETRYEDVGGVLTATQTGQRKFTLQVQAIVPANLDDLWAIGVLERARTRLRRPSTIDALLELDVALIRIGPSVPVAFKDGGRQFSSGTLEVFFGCTASEDDPIPAGWIQYLVISSHLKDGAGELPPAQQMVDVEVPTIPPTH